MSTARAKVRSILFCDDVRVESTGKLIVIGVYSSEIVVEKIPSSARFRTAIVVDIPSEGNYEFKFRLTDRSDNSRMEAKLELSAIEDGNNILVPGFQFGMDVTEQGEIDVEYFNGEWEKIGTWSITALEHSAPEVDKDE